MSDPYWLGKNSWASTRLRLQHELTQTIFDRNLLDPSIPIGDDHAIVADVAAGTGTWALELGEKHPNFTIEGLDVNLEEVPPKAWLPSNVSFRKFDLLQDVPNELVGRYDVVHLQYVMIFVLDANVDEVLNRLIKMLKPGGYLQWTDSNSNRYSWRTGAEGQEAVEAPKLYEMTKAILADRAWVAWFEELPGMFDSAGLKDVKYTAPEPKPSTWQPILMNWIWALEEGFGFLRLKAPDKSAVIDEWMEQRKKVVDEAEKLKVGMNMRMQRCVGRKPGH